jgi:hypothetical protein
MRQSRQVVPVKEQEEHDPVGNGNVEEYSLSQVHPILNNQEFLTQSQTPGKPNY